MQVTQTQTDGLKREFKVVIAADELKTQVDRRLNELSRTVRLPGFRPGKVPTKVVRQRFKDQILSDVANDLIPRLLGEATNVIFRGAIGSMLGANGLAGLRGAVRSSRG